ncbi:hypothetical protein BHE74_00011377 [Ensete ventricosum]|nr:hypothetical protein BHE74_00011377 [Ensete ventricosum]RZR89734.1 hypothetical protein BHM03_00017510 [Ensete ventricosum]
MLRVFWHPHGRSACSFQELQHSVVSSHGERWIREFFSEAAERWRLLRSSSDEFVEQCISKADCLTLAVRKQRRGVGGYLISTRWQKNFWLLA